MMRMTKTTVKAKVPVVNPHWAAAREIAANFSALGIKARAVSGRITPYGITCQLALTRVNAMLITKALRMAPVLEAKHGYGGIRVWSNDGLINVQIPLPNAPKITFVNQLKPKEGCVALGVGLDGQAIYSTWADNPHLMLLGPTGCGKTTLTRAILQQLPGHQIAISAFKAKDWRDVGGATVMTVLDEIEAFGQWVVKELRRRAPLGEDLPLCWVVDDAFNLLSACNLPLDEIASLGRGLDTHLIIASQRAGDAVGGAMTAGNIPGRVVFRTASASDSAVLTGRRGVGAEQLKRFHALFVTPDDVVQFKAAVPSGVVTSQPVTWACDNERDEKGANYGVGKSQVTVTSQEDLHEQIRNLHEQGLSKNKIIETVWNGGRNSHRWNVVNEALSSNG